MERWWCEYQWAALVYTRLRRRREMDLYVGNVRKVLKHWSGLYDVMRCTFFTGAVCVCFLRWCTLLFT